MREVLAFDSVLMRLIVVGKLNASLWSKRWVEIGTDAW